MDKVSEKVLKASQKIYGFAEDIQQEFELTTQEIKKAIDLTQDGF